MHLGIGNPKWKNTAKKSVQDGERKSQISPDESQRRIVIVTTNGSIKLDEGAFFTKEDCTSRVEQLNKKFSFADYRCELLADEAWCHSRKYENGLTWDCYSNKYKCETIVAGYTLYNRWAKSKSKETFGPISPCTSMTLRAAAKLMAE